jgi:phage-related protein
MVGGIAMPETVVLLFTEAEGICPLIKWLDELPSKVQDKCIVRVERLSEMGHELRRPEADYLRDGIYELRASYQGVHYRMLYFFHGDVAVISHGLAKEKAIPAKEIARALGNRKLFMDAPEIHTYKGV